MDIGSDDVSISEWPDPLIVCRMIWAHHSDEGTIDSRLWWPPLAEWSGWIDTISTGSLIRTMDGMYITMVTS